MMFTRITANPNQMGGVPCIRGLPIPVATVVGLVAEGQTVRRILPTQYVNAYFRPRPGSEDVGHSSSGPHRTDRCALRRSKEVPANHALPVRKRREALLRIPRNQAP